jgi:hypothetical protein
MIDGVWAMTSRPSGALSRPAGLRSSPVLMALAPARAMAHERRQVPVLISHEAVEPEPEGPESREAKRIRSRGPGEGDAVRRVDLG